MATTRFPAEQNPAVDPELPQPATPQTVEVTSPGEVAVASTNAAVLVALNVGSPTAEPQQVPVQDSLSLGEELVNTSAPAAVAPTNTGIFANPDFSPGAITGTPAPVNLATNPGAISPFGGSAFNAAAAQNPEAAAAAAQQEQANQEAATSQRAREQAAIQAQFQSPADGDWRVRLRLAPNATYLYKDSTNALLAPLAASNGVVFPYMPSISTSYNADYSDTALTHSNYKGYFYNSSYVGDISITGIFTAQDTREANYMLAVIHFFRSVTKMFYGQDAQRGSPPPLVYLIGLGNYQFNNHPCVVKSFNYSLPNDVDYIRTKPNNYNLNFNQNLNKTQASPSPGIGSVLSRILNSGLRKGALPGTGSQELVVQQSVTNIANSTYVPTKIEIQLTLMPIQTRSQQSQQFSVKDYSSGKLLAGGFW